MVFLSVLEDLQQGRTEIAGRRPQNLQAVTRLRHPEASDQHGQHDLFFAYLW
jgi:hypothetical protein